MRKYRIRSEVDVQRNGVTRTSYYPEYRWLWLWFIPIWYPTETWGIMAEDAKPFSSLLGAKESIQAHLKNWNKQYVKTHHKIYKVCIQESKESIELC